MAEFMAAKAVGNSEEMVSVVKASRKTLESSDEMWIIDDALLRSLCGATAEQRACASILAELPTAQRRITVIDAKQRLEVLAASDAFKLAPDHVIAGLRFVLAKLSLLHLGCPLEIKLDTMSKLARDCIQQFQHFLVRPGKNKGEQISGEPAYREMVSTVTASIDQMEEVAAQDSADVMKFRWLAQSDKKAEVTRLIAALVVAQPPAAKKPKASVGGSSSSTSGPAAATAAIRLQRKKSAAMSYFE